MPLSTEQPGDLTLQDFKGNSATTIIVSKKDAAWESEVPVPLVDVQQVGVQSELLLCERDISNEELLKNFVNNAVIQ